METKINYVVSLIGLALIQTLIFMLVLYILELNNIIFLVVGEHGFLNMAETGLFFFLMMLLADIIAEPIRYSIYKLLNKNKDKTNKIKRELQ